MRSDPMDDLGCVRVHLTGADETVVRAAQAWEGWWLTTGPGHPYRVPGEPGVWVRMYVDTAAQGVDADSGDPGGAGA